MTYYDKLWLYVRSSKWPFILILRCPQLLQLPHFENPLLDFSRLSNCLFFSNYFWVTQTQWANSITSPVKMKSKKIFNNCTNYWPASGSWFFFFNTKLVSVVWVVYILVTLEHLSSKQARLGLPSCWFGLEGF